MSQTLTLLTNLAPSQQRFLAIFVSQGGEENFGQRFNLTSHRGKRQLELPHLTIAVAISDSDLLSLARLGYIRVYADPPGVAFNESVLKLFGQTETGQIRAINRVRRAEVVRVYTWAAASILMMLSCAFLVWFAVASTFARSAIVESVALALALVALALSAISLRNCYAAIRHVMNLSNPKTQAA